VCGEFRHARAKLPSEDRAALLPGIPRTALQEEITEPDKRFLLLLLWVNFRTFSGSFQVADEAS